MTKKRPPGRRLLACVGVVLAANVVAVALPPSGDAVQPQLHPRHCGLFQSGVEWVDSAHIKGHFYNYAVLHMKCHSKHSKVASDPIVIATLGLHRFAHPYGFTCHVSFPVGSGYCTKGNVHSPGTLKHVSWAPQVDCAVPDPPYTPATLPAMCHT